MTSILNQSAVVECIGERKFKIKEQLSDLEEFET